MQSEIEGLPETARLLLSGRWLVACASAREAPRIVREIGRLREIAFRAIGEGTGRELDLDRYDESYQHLFVWDRQRSMLAGAYRLVDTESFRSHELPYDLYTHSLFAYGPEFLARLGPALELGRAFVRPEYQRCSRVLALLWQGIAGVLARTRGRRRLFGAVSISALYSPDSRALIAAALLAHHRYAPARGLVYARAPFTPCRIAASEVSALRDSRSLDQAVRAREPDGKGLPVLLRRYLDLGGEFAALHVDRSFCDTLDALMVLDPARADAGRLARIGVAPEIAA
ncbi:MAG: GNAT family N-acetyltransferase [Myxococcota bacterium]